MLVLGAQCSRADVLGSNILTVVVSTELIDYLGITRLHVDVGCPVNGRVILLSYQQFARFTVMV